MSDRLLPFDDDQRHHLHQEVHARPSARIRLPALLVYVAVMNQGVSKAQEAEHLQRILGTNQLDHAALENHFLRIRLPDGVLKWERHTEFSRYTWIQTLPLALLESQDLTNFQAYLDLDPAWWQAIPGRTLAAVVMVILPHETKEGNDAHETWSKALKKGKAWFQSAVVASKMGHPTHSLALTDFQLHPNGFEWMCLLTESHSSETRVGRAAQRLLELETYRLMALRGLPVAKTVATQLGFAENQLAHTMQSMVDKQQNDQILLDDLVLQAAKVEHLTAEHAYRFAATSAYYQLVQERIHQLRETPLHGTQTLGEFMQRRLSPAMNTVMAADKRLSGLSSRIHRASGLLRTRVDIATEAQNQMLLSQLGEGQRLQLQLQSMVEGLSIAAISYYVISLILYLAKAVKALGIPIHPELVAGGSIPLVLWSVWHLTQRIHAKLHKH